MRCTDRLFIQKRRRRRQLFLRLSITLLFILCISFGLYYLVSTADQVRKYEIVQYADSVYQSKLYADELCVTNDEIEFKEFYRNDKFHGALLFDLKNNEPLYAENIHDKLYPASTTKLLTAYLALKYGDLDDTVTVGDLAVNVPSDSSKAGLMKGDRLTLRDLLYSLMLASGNDSAVAVAEHISGNVEDFMDLMNKEAKELGATNTHFVNPHGYHDDDHYTTAYDLYLIFNACVQNEEFVKIISTKQKDATITSKNGTTRDVTWWQSNKFISGAREIPKGINMIGGKTGTTFEAGYCLVMYGTDESDVPYMAVMMGATSSRNLYDNMTFLWSAITQK